MLAPVVAAGTWLCVCLHAAAEPLPEPEPAADVVSACPVEAVPPGSPADAAVVAFSAGGCVGCHGGPEAGNHAVHSFAATLWATRDPHARAFETLHDPRSRKMAALLGIGAAHRAPQCLACHSTQAACESPLPPEVLADGVSCGACHGDATRWLEAHTLPGWQGLDAESRATLGYRELADATARVRTCIPCHVGDGSREVNHDMIAAGHPRLAFEFAAYQRLWPRHWSPQGRAESRADFTERAWAVGQAETLAAVARLLEVRARRAIAGEGPTDPSVVPPGAGRWPEFAEFDCYSCHRALSPERVAGAAADEFRNPAPGAPSWQPWSASAARLLAMALDDPGVAAVDPAATAVHDLFGRGWSAGDPDRLAQVIAQAQALERAAAAAGRSLAARDTVALDAAPARVEPLVALNHGDWRTWDSATQTYLLMDSALDGGPARLGVWGDVVPASDARAALDGLRAGLRFPPGAGGPDGFDPARFQRERAHVLQGRGGPR